MRGSLINIQSNPIETRNLQILHSSISFDVIISEIRYYLFQNNIIMVLGVVSCKIISVYSDFLIWRRFSAFYIQGGHICIVHKEIVVYITSKRRSRTSRIGFNEETSLVLFHKVTLKLYLMKKISRYNKVRIYPKKYGLCILNVNF